ncbi:MAG: FHA domain-containing protein [Methylophilaceae bacterium]|nr:FHA domain-containing protein [Methylophilaceae bacterium]
MAKLTLSLEGHVLNEYALDKERIGIGRRPTNDIHIDNLAMSGLHATLLTIGNDSFLEDLASTNGTYINGKSIKKHLLQHGDVIELGKYQLKYENEKLLSKASSDSSNGFEKTILLKPSPSRQPANNLEQNSPEALIAKPFTVIVSQVVEPSPSVAPISLGNLQVLNGSSTGRQLVLNKTLTTLGKPGVQVAVITKRTIGYFITHVEGKSLPIVNNESIGVQAYQLNDHDIIELAGVKMEFYFA